MSIKYCSHIRITDKNYSEFDVEEYIKYIEQKFNIDFRSLPQWKELTKLLHVTATDYKRKIQDAKLRKSFIVHKLFTQFRPSPFELSDNMVRTAMKWEAMKVKERKYSVGSIQKESNSIITATATSYSNIHEHESSEQVNDETAHQNSEIIKSQDEIQYNVDDFKKRILPPKIINNLHKCVSFSEPNYTVLINLNDSYKHESKTESEKELLSLRQTSSVVCLQNEISLTYDNLREQTIKFSVTNCSANYIHIRFKKVTDIAPFKRVKVLPVTPLKLCPGIAVVYKLVFKLAERKKEFTSQLLFTVGRKVYDDAPTEALRIPIVTKFMETRDVFVSEEVTIPPLYVWQMKDDSEGEYPKGAVEISVNDYHYYYLRIVKRDVDLSKDSDSSEESMLQEEVKESEKKGKFFSSEKIDDPETSVITDNPLQSSIKVNQGISSKTEISAINISMLISCFMGEILKDIVEQVLETFIFESNYLFLTPDTKKKVAVYFTKIERIGCHNCYYDFELYDPETEDLIFVKTVRIFAEILPHPIQINPDLLDMSNSHVTHGICEDRFIITNTHKLYPVTIKMRLSKEIKKLLRITPMETVVPNKSSVSFFVRFCSRDRNAKVKDLVHFAFEIFVIGHKIIYDKVPPFCFEIIAPCVNEYLKN